MLKLRAFRAIDEEDTCLRYMEGHARVLTDYGITNISTNNATWKDNPSVYAIIAEDEEGTIVGGARLHLTNELEPLPVERAVGGQDPRVKEIIYSYPLSSVAEACGFWNAKKVANLGVSVLLAKAIASICSQIEVRSVFCFCGRHTSYIAKLMGSVLEEKVGDRGMFSYPTVEFYSYFFHNPDIINLPLAEEINRQKIQNLREKPSQRTIETVTKKSVEIQYFLSIPNHQRGLTKQIVLNSSI